MNDIQKLAEITCCIGQLKERIETKERELSESKAQAELLQNLLKQLRPQLAAVTKEVARLQEALKECWLPIRAILIGDNHSPYKEIGDALREQLVAADKAASSAISPTEPHGQ